MVRRWVLAVTVIFLLFALLSGCSGCSGGSSGSDAEAIRGVVEGYFAALNVPDEERAYGYVLPESAAAEWLDAFFSERVPFAEKQGVKYEYSFTIKDITVLEGGREARVRISYTFRTVGSQGGLAAPDFEETIELQKQGRTWRITVAPLAS